MLMLLTGTGEGANRNTALSPVCHVFIYREELWIFFLFVDFLNAWKVIHSFLHLLVAQYDLWFLLIQFLWMWDLLAPCLRDHIHTLDMLLVLETLTIFICTIYSLKWRSKKTILTIPRFDGILFYELLTSIFPPPSLL